MISQAALTEYKTLYKKRFNADLSDEEALSQALSLLNLVKAVYKPLPKQSVSAQIKPSSDLI